MVLFPMTLSDPWRLRDCSNSNKNLALAHHLRLWHCHRNRR